MSILERTIQSVIFELGAILIGMLVIEFIPHEGQPLLLMINTRNQTSDGNRI